MPNPNDPAYKKARKQMARVQASLRIGSILTDDTDDDLLVDIFDQIVNERFDEVYDIVKAKKKKPQ